MTRIGKRLPQRKRTLPRAELPRLSVAMYMLQGQRRPTYNRGQPPPERIKRKARELLTSETGLKHRGRRCIEPEAVFGQVKSNMAYRRFRHFGKDKVTMDFAFFAIAFNIKKLCSKIAKQTNNGIHPIFACFCLYRRFYRLRIKYFGKNLRNRSPEKYSTLSG